MPDSRASRERGPPRASAAAPAVSADGDLLAAVAVRFLRQRQRQHALVVVRFGFRAVEIARQRERAIHLAVVALGVDLLLVLLPGGLAFDFGADRHLVAV